MKTWLSWWSVWTFIHWHFDMRQFKTWAAFWFFYCSVRPFIPLLGTQYSPNCALAACFYSARAPTDIKLGFGFPAISSLDWTLLSRVNIDSRSSLSGGRTWSTLPIVFRIPRHYRKPLGSRRQRNSQISFCSKVGLWFWSPTFLSSLKMSEITVYNLSMLYKKWGEWSCCVIVSTKNSFTGKWPAWYQSSMITQICLRKLPWG